ncbi:MAG: 50S ribosomal protein L29 [Candidatus Microgenomates bacterium]|jgi:ribosomal protein L29
MKRKDFTGLREKTIKDLKALASKKRIESIKTKMGIMSGKEKNLKLHRNLDREIAKILTLIREKEIIEKLQP